jgi:hypothetical protein
MQDTRPATQPESQDARACSGQDAVPMLYADVTFFVRKAFAAAAELPAARVVAARPR